MADRQQRSNREKRKPKAEKPKAPTAQPSSFVRAQSAVSSKQGAGNKRGK